MSFEQNFSAQVEKPKDNYGDDFIVRDRRELDSRKSNPRKREDFQFIDGLNKRVVELAGGADTGWFDKIKELETENKSVEDMDWEQGIKYLVEGTYNSDTKLSELVPSDLQHILKPLDRDTRELLFTQRRKISLEQALKVMKSRLEDTVVAYHVSPYDIKFEDGLGGDNNDELYFSTDLKRLFNQKEAKYIYAFRMPKKELASRRYTDIDCFGKTRMNGGREAICDKLSIFDPKDPSYRKKVLEEIGASFEENYYAASDSFERFQASQKPESAA